MAPEFEQHRQDHIKNDPLVIEHFVGAICPIPDAMRLGSGHDMAGNPLNDDEIFLATVSTAGTVLGAAGALDVPGTGMLDEVGEATDAGRTVARVEGAVDEALDASGVASSIRVIGATPYNGGINRLLEGLSSRGSRHLDQIVNRISDVDNVTLCTPAEFAEYAARHNMPSGTSAFISDSNHIYLNRARGYDQLLEDLAHEGTHSIDFGKGGLFEGRNAGTLVNEDLYISEFRAYQAQVLVNPNTTHNSSALIEKFVTENYPSALPVLNILKYAKFIHW